MKRWILALAFLLAPAFALAAGSSVTWTKSYAGPKDGRRIAIYTAAIVSDDAAGTASGGRVISGTLLFTQAKSGATTPTDNWDFTLTDDMGWDVLGGTGANVSNTTGLNMVPLSAAGGTAMVNGRPVSGTLTLNVTNMGNSKTGTVRVFVLE